MNQSGRSREGDTLAGKYALEGRLGVGGMGEVYRARNTAMGRAVAIKLLLAEHANDETVVARFLTEARAANLVRHPNVVDVLDIGRDDDGTPFIVQELLEGKDLARHVLDAGGRLPYVEALTLIVPIVEAVGLAHARGVVHRDLKPENVFLALIGDTIVPKLLDFGISQVLAAPDSVRMTATGVAMGTPAYMSPEQIKGAKSVDARTDVWSLGVILFEMVSGELPFPAESAGAMFVQISIAEPVPLASVAPSVPLDLTRVIARCLRKDRTERYASASDLARDLRNVLENKAILRTGELELNFPDAVDLHSPALELSHGDTLEQVVLQMPSPPSFEPEEPPSGLDLEVVRSSPEPRRASFDHPRPVRPTPTPAVARDADAVMRAVVLGLVALGVAAALTALDPTPVAWLLTSATGVLGGLPAAALLALAGAALVGCVVSGWSGARMAPLSWGHVAAAAGLLASSALLALHVLLDTEAPTPPIAFAIAAALVPLGAALYALRKGSAAWSSGASPRRGIAIAFAALVGVGVFVAAQIVRAGAAS